MAEIHCRVCGEAWDSTGGLHHSHSDMNWWEYEQLVHGKGCPSCGGDTPGLEQYSSSPEAFGKESGQCEARKRRWLSSVIGLSEGEILSEDDLQNQRPNWFGRHYRDENDEPLWSEFATDRQQSDLKDVSAYLDDGNVVCRLCPEQVRSGGDLVYQSNFECLVAYMGEKGIGHVVDNSGYILVHLGHYVQGELSLHEESINYCYDTASALESYPVVDDIHLARLEAEEHEKEIGEWIDSYVSHLSDETQLTEYVVELIINDNRDSIFYEESGEKKVPSPDEAIAFLCQHLPGEYPGWVLLKSRLSDDSWLAVPSWQGFSPGSNIWLGGILCSEQEDPKRVTNIAASEFQQKMSCFAKGRFELQQYDFGEAPDKIRLDFLRFLAESC